MGLPERRAGEHGAGAAEFLDRFGHRVVITRGPEERDTTQALQPPDHPAYRDDPKVRHIRALAADMVLEAVAKLLRSEGQ